MSCIKFIEADISNLLILTDKKGDKSRLYVDKEKAITKCEKIAENIFNLEVGGKMCYGIFDRKYNLWVDGFKPLKFEDKYLHRFWTKIIDFKIGNYLFLLFESHINISHGTNIYRADKTIYLDFYPNNENKTKYVIEDRGEFYYVNVDGGLYKYKIFQDPKYYRIGEKLYALHEGDCFIRRGLEIFEVSTKLGEIIGNKIEGFNFGADGPYGAAIESRDWYDKFIHRHTLIDNILFVVISDILYFMADVADAKIYGPLIIITKLDGTVISNRGVDIIMAHYCSKVKQIGPYTYFDHCKYQDCKGNIHLNSGEIYLFCSKNIHDLTRKAACFVHNNKYIIYDDNTKLFYECETFCPIE